MQETHPFGVFSPADARYLILGSFAPRGRDGRYHDWFYGNTRNQFWMILEAIYGQTLASKADKEALLRRRKIAITDIIYMCERRDGSSLDVNLINPTFNLEQIGQLLRTHPIEKIYFTSRYVEQGFRKHFKELVEAFPEIELITLPSPSPRYAAMPLMEKIQIWQRLLPPKRDA